MAQQIINIGLSPNDGTGDTLRDGGIKINDNFTELYSNLNNRVFLQNVPAVNWNDPIPEQIADWLNNSTQSSLADWYDGVFHLGYLINPQDIVFFNCLKFTGGGNVENHLFYFKRGAGTYGTFGADTCAANDFEYFTSDSKNINIANEPIVLGEIGTTAIEDAVNNSGPYELETDITYIFYATRSGIDYQYYYIGPQGLSIGLGENQTTEYNYIDLTNIEPEIPDTRPLVTIDSRNFFFEKGVTSGTVNTGNNVEVNDLALGGVFFDPGVGKYMKGDLKCIDNTGDLTTGIGTKWKKQPGAYPIE